MAKDVYLSNFDSNVLKDLKDVLPPENLSTKKIDRIAVAHGIGQNEFNWIQQGEYPYLPDVVVWPTSTEQVSKIMQLANKHRVVVINYGGGSGSVSGTVFYNGGICLDIKKFTKFEISDVNMTVTVGAGWNGAQLEDQLDKLGYTMGHFPQSLRSSVVGGWIAPIAVGTFSTKYGKTDDILVALEVVLPTGEILQTAKSPKASCGINLNHLFLGSEGSYGTVTEATMKIWPRPEVRKYAIFTFSNTHDGIEAIRKIMRTGIYPAVVRLYDEAESMENIEKYGYEDGFALLYLGFEGRTDLVELEMKISEECCRNKGGIYKGDEAGKNWEKTRYSTSSFLNTKKKPGCACDTVEVSAPWDKLETVWREMRNALTPYAQIIHVHFSHIYHVGGMCYVIFYTLTGKDAHESERNYYRCVKAALNACVHAGGTIAHHHGVGTMKAPWMEAQHGIGFEVMKKIKKVLDPNNIMNPAVLRLGGDAHVGEI